MNYYRERDAGELLHAAAVQTSVKIVDEDGDDEGSRCDVSIAHHEHLLLINFGTSW